MKQQKFSVKKRIHSFKYAFNGLRILFKYEHNARIHLFATICVLAAGILLKISTFEWFAVIFAIGIVIAFEAINSAIESLADFVSPQQHHLIQKIKDLAAAAVLVSAISAAIVGFLIFIPRIMQLI